MIEKRCRDCGEVKPIDAFPVCRTGRDGRRTFCKACNAAKARAWYRSHADRARETMQKRYQRLGAQGMCVVCGQHPAVPGNQLCETCGEKARARSYERYVNLDGDEKEAYIAYQRESTKRRYARLKSEGICPHCRKRPITTGPRGGRSHCDECRVEKRRHREARHHDRA